MIIKAKIVEIYKAVGVENPLEQKLVEPTARAFGGREKEGEADFSNVKWQEMIDYFTLEALSITGDIEKAFELRDKIYQKQGYIHHHQTVYGGDKY